MFDGVADSEPYNDSVRIVQPVSEHSFLKSIAREGDVILSLLRVDPRDNPDVNPFSNGQVTNQR
jgi:hypothetical protein